MQRVGRMLDNLIRTSAAMQKLHLKTRGAQRWNDANVHMVSTATFASFPVSGCNIHPFTPGNLIALSSILCGLAGMLTTRFLYYRKIMLPFR